MKPPPPPEIPNCRFQHTIKTPAGPVEVEYEMPPPKNIEQFLTMFETVVKHFPPSQEQLLAIAARERSLGPPPIATNSTKKRRK